MRLIDADELKKDDEVTMWLSNDAIRTGKQLKMFSELFINKIDNMPTVQAIPIPENATNGDVIKAMFPNLKVKKNRLGDINLISGYQLGLITIIKEWWNAPYRAKSEG